MLKFDGITIKSYGVTNLNVDKTRVIDVSEYDIKKVKLARCKYEYQIIAQRYYTQIMFPEDFAQLTVRGVYKKTDEKFGKVSHRWEYLYPLCSDSGKDCGILAKALNRGSTIVLRKDWS